LYIGTHASQFAAFDMTGSNFSSSFECVDTEGLANRTMTIQASSPLSNGSQSISASNVSMLASTNTVTAGSCTTGSNANTWTAINSAGTILNKASSAGDICTITATTVNLAVHVPASQAIGTYTGTLSLDMPF
jgi:hypothetical protein